MDKGRLQTLYASLPVGLMLWVAFGFLCAVGLTVSLVDLSKLPAEETWRANNAHQRAIVDAVTGMVSGLKAEEADTFDVGTASEQEPREDAPPDMGDVVERPPIVQPEVSAELPRLRETPEVADIPAVPRSADSLVKAPAPEAVEKVGELILPRKTSQGIAPWRLYGRGFTRKEDQNLLAIVIIDAGFSNETLASMIALPKEVSVAVSPYAADAAAKVEALRNAGHEVWTMLPTMTDDYPRVDPGPLGLLITHPPDVAQSRVQHVLAAAVGAVGVVLPPEEAVTDQANLWNVAFTEVSGRGLLTLATRSDRSIDQIVPDKERQDTIRRADIILDSTPASAFIRSKLSALEGQLTATPRDVIVVASARPQTLSILSDWLKKQQSFTLAPLSATYRSYEPPPEPVEEKKSHGGGH